MYKNFFLFLITLFSKFYITKQTFEEMNLPLNSTSEFKGFTIRKINESSIYISNYFQEVFFDFKTIPKPDDEFKRENLEEGTFMGSLYPQIKISSINNKTQPIYYISLSNSNSFIINYYNFITNKSESINMKKNNSEYLPISVSLNENSDYFYGVERYYYLNKTFNKYECTQYFPNSTLCKNNISLYFYPWKVYQRIKRYNDSNLTSYSYDVVSQDHNIDKGAGYNHQQQSKGFILTMRSGHIILYDMYRYDSNKKFVKYLNAIHSGLGSYSI